MSFVVKGPQNVAVFIELIDEEPPGIVNSVFVASTSRKGLRIGVSS